MKYRYYSQLPLESVPGVCAEDGKAPLLGKVLVQTSDNVGHSMYEINPLIGQKVVLRSPDGSVFNHIYVCLTGSGSIQLASDQSFRLEAGNVLALPPAEQGCFVADESSQPTRIVVIHSQSCQTDSSLPRPIHRDLASIVGSERDVDWTRGRSRRFLNSADGFNVTVTRTTGYPGYSSPLWYKHNYESAYFFRGDVTYEWDDGKSCASFKQTAPSDGDGMLMLMDQNDPHTVNTGDRECETVCVFYPALNGTETHDFSKPGFSEF